MAPPKKGDKAATKEAVTEIANENVPVTRKRTRGATASNKEQQQNISVPEKKVKKDKPVATTKDVVEELDVATKEKKDDVKEPVVEKRKRGRPPNKQTDTAKKTEVKEVDPTLPKRGRGRPRKTVSA
ncbi:unnamed protein product [Mucor hiemalis]